jgi:hypothetical protein
MFYVQQGVLCPDRAQTVQRMRSLVLRPVSERLQPFSVLQSGMEHSAPVIVRTTDLL